MGFEIWSISYQSLNHFHGTKAGSRVSATSAQLESRELRQGQAAPVGPVHEVGQAACAGFCHIWHSTLAQVEHGSSRKAQQLDLPLG